MIKLKYSKERKQRGELSTHRKARKIGGPCVSRKHHNAPKKLYLHSLKEG